MITLEDVKGRQALEQEFEQLQEEGKIDCLGHFESFRQGYLNAIHQIWEKDLKEKMDEILSNTPDIKKRIGVALQDEHNCDVLAEDIPSYNEDREER